MRRKSPPKWSAWLWVMKMSFISLKSILFLKREKLTPSPASKRYFLFSVSNKNDEQKRDGEGIPEEEPKIMIRFPLSSVGRG
jgi:hypothetical protein